MARTISDDVRWVGDTLGEVLQALAGAALYEDVEGMRRAAKRAREADDEAAREELARRAEAMAPARALDVVRAFTLYFQLVNLAEDVHRARELRRREREGGAEAVADSLAAVIGRLCADAGRDEVRAALDELELGYVFTAHPTEARRRTTERLLARARRGLVERDRQELTDSEAEQRDRRLRAAVEALWLHAAERTERPEVLDEVKAGLWYLEHVLLDVVPRAQRRLARAMAQTCGDVDEDALPLPWRFGSWMGADRDGNPFVDEAVTERALALQREAALRRYERDLSALADALAADARRLPESAELARALERAAAAVPEARAVVEARNPGEPLRRLLSYARERLARAARWEAGGYTGPDALLGDLRAMRAALAGAGAGALAHDALLELEWRVRCFGFHLAALDVREDSAVHNAVVAELLGEPGYADADDAARRAMLERLELPARDVELSDEARRLMALFEGLARMQGRHGAQAIGTYAISMTRSAADVLEVLRLAELHHVARELDVVPLLETPADLARAGELLGVLFDDERYRAHLRGRGDVQELLLGYSDSMKRGGVLASRVEVLAAQRAAAEVCRAHGVTLRVFHGRGGSVSRGGGPTSRAIGALPREAFSGRMKITEQGEMRAANFADPLLAGRYLEQTGAAALTARVEARARPAAGGAEDRELLERLAAASQRAYRALVEDPELVTYFSEATPLEAISALHIASRPSKRRDRSPGLDDLRAIPWVFAWSQSRHVTTGWYGVGSALAELRAEVGIERLQQLTARSAFFRDLLENVEMALAKADLPIAARYAELCADAALGRRLFERIRAEHARSVEEILAVLEQDELLDDDPVLQRSIRLRNPYVDPLSYLQVVALRRARAGGDDADEWGRVARAAVQGIAAGLRHTG